MTHLARQSAEHAQPVFTDAAKSSVRYKAKRPPPFSLRLNAKERQTLETAAAGMPLGSYIKARLFDGELSPRRTRGRAPVKDHAALAQVLGMIGNMRLASNLNQLAKSANIGTLPLTPEVEEELATACAAVIAMRAELMRALGYAPEDGT
ncbi:hypothetical protein [Salipiger thiooxidans]|uniref:hypothetical protein n=1 Tax=Salipiger thiooxidans TaxID=282683 RepID=UPI001CD3EF22|nr:hypothetical protein [Salipiger thiooxidans]MCA0851344.1 hypothetical protein [Salipiger thiooxidans]